MSTPRFVLAAFAATLFSASVLADGAVVNAISARSASPSPMLTRQAGFTDMTVESGQRAVQPRTPIEKPPSNSILLPINVQTGAPLVTGRVLVKFHDQYRVRATRTPSPVLQTADGVAMTTAMNLLQSIGGGIAWQAIEQSDEWIASLEARAASRSGVAAMDFAGFVYVMPKGEDLVSCARAFNDLPEVEFAVIEQMPVPAMGPPPGIGQSGPQTGCGAAPGGDCIPAPGGINCHKPAIPQPPFASPSGRCSGYGIPGTGCSCCEPEEICGSVICPDPDDGPPLYTCTRGCNYDDCCAAVVATMPECNENFHGWDALCAAYANTICGGGGIPTNYTVYAPSGPFAPFEFGTPSTVVPGSYKFDACFALRTAGSPAFPDDAIQGQYYSQVMPGFVATYPYELITVTGYSTALATSGLVTGLAVTGVDPTFTSSSRFAMQDPSFERTTYEISSSCFTVSTNRGGCVNTPCCVYVCTVDPQCCIVGWDSNCVRLAGEITTNNPCVQPLAGQIPASTTPGPSDFPTLNMANFPASGNTPNFAPTFVPSGWGPQARGLQLWSVKPPVGSLFEDFSVDPTVAAIAVTPPTNASQLSSTRMFLNTGYRGGGLDLAGFEQAALALGATTNQTRGAGITIGVIDNSAFVNHEELAGNVEVEPGFSPITSPVFGVDAHHGTAVLGIMLAKDDGKGITGVAPDARAILFPAVVAGQGGRFFNAMASAVGTLEAGDVLCIPLDFPTIYIDPLTGVVQQLAGTVLQSAAVFALAQTANQIGISTVVAAGNECTVVQTAPTPATPPTTTITVGACIPGQPRLGNVTGLGAYTRLPFSNYYRTENPLQPVDVSAWGAYVTTCGFGDLWRGDNSASSSGETNNLRTYTLQFGGTSAAAAMVAGCVARMQSTAKGLFGAPLLPQQVKSLARENQINQGYPFGPGTSADNPCFGDSSPDEKNPPNLIGGFINMGPSIITSLSSQIECIYPPNVVDVSIQVLVGRLMSGGPVSICELDGATLRVRSARGSNGVNPSIGPTVFYPSSALITDVMVTATTTLTSPDQLVELAVTGIGAAQPPNNVYTIYYVYNVALQRWLMLPTTLGFFTQGGGVVLSGPIGLIYNLTNLIDTSSGPGKIRIRAVTIAPPISTIYDVLWNEIIIAPNPPFQPPPP